MCKVLAIALLALATLGGASRSDAGDAQAWIPGKLDGRKYIDALSQMIGRSDKIVVTEHSFLLDLYDLKANKSLIPDEIVYGTRELNQQQKSLFIRTVETLDPKTQDAFPMCIFVPHHTVGFYQQERLISTMKICFHCGQVEWDGPGAVPPWSLYSGLKTFIKSIGFEPERDWKALAEQRVSAKAAN